MRDIAAALVVLAGAFVLSTAVVAHIFLISNSRGLEDSGPANTQFVSVLGIAVIIFGGLGLGSKVAPRQ